MKHKDEKKRTNYFVINYEKHK